MLAYLAAGGSPGRAAEVLEAASNHPMEKGIIRRDLIGLRFMAIGFFDLA